MRVLVTGAAGYLGRIVVRRLAAAGYDVVAMTRAARVSFPAGVAEVRADLRDAASLDAAVSTVDAVCHLAALTRVRESFARPLEYYAVNLGGTVNLLQALVRSGRVRRLVVASTHAVYGAAEEQPIREDTPPRPASPYGASKLAADQLVGYHAATGAIGAVVLRPFNIAGAVEGIADGDETRIVPKAIAVAAGRAELLEVNGDGSAVRDYVHVADTARAVELALGACAVGRCDVYNLGTGTGAAVRDIIAVTEEVTGRAINVRRRPPAPEPVRLVGDSSKIRAELGWKPERSDLRTIITDAWTVALPH